MFTCFFVDEHKVTLQKIRNHIETLILLFVIAVLQLTYGCILTPSIRYNLLFTVTCLLNTMVLVNLCVSVKFLNRSGVLSILSRVLIYGFLGSLLFFQFFEAENNTPLIDELLFIQQCMVAPALLILSLVTLFLVLPKEEKRWEL